ncbi:hypothetical protein N9I25_01985 [Hellea sp.]|nr:hypothetical protein [Hellea sp.]
MIRKITLGITLFFSTLMFASPAYADWEEIIKSEGGTFYVDFDRIRKGGDGYVYYWDLTDYLKPSPSGILSSKVYNQGDCEVFRSKTLNVSFHKQPMGEGSGETYSPPNPEWEYPPPNTIGEIKLKIVCSRVGL